MLFNVGDYVGRFAAEKVQWPKPGKVRKFYSIKYKTLLTTFGPHGDAHILVKIFFFQVNQPCTVASMIVLALSLTRLVFIPLFMYSSTFQSDSVYIVIMLLFSFSNGYLSNICMMSGPQVCHPDDQMTAASLMVAFLGIGLATGAALSNLFVAIT